MEINPQYEITIIEKQINYVWVRGVSGAYRFEAKVYCFGSKYGIDEGRISKFTVWIKPDVQGHKHWVANYDRGWDIRPQKKHRQFVDNIIGLLEEMPQPEDLEKNMRFSLD